MTGDHSLRLCSLWPIKIGEFSFAVLLLLDEIRLSRGLYKSAVHERELRSCRGIRRIDCDRE